MITTRVPATDASPKFQTPRADLKVSLQARALETQSNVLPEWRINHLTQHAESLAYSLDSEFGSLLGWTSKHRICVHSKRRRGAWWRTLWQTIFSAWLSLGRADPGAEELKEHDCFRRGLWTRRSRTVDTRNFVDTAGGSEISKTRSCTDCNHNSSRGIRSASVV
jgi:hypothetical protein